MKNVSDGAFGGVKLELDTFIYLIQVHFCAFIDITNLLGEIDIETINSIIIFIEL